MKSHLIVAACSIALVNLMTLAPVQAQSRMKACADEWNAMKAANQTAGKTYRAFQKECLARAATGSPTTPAAAPAAPAQPTTTTAQPAAPATPAAKTAKPAAKTTTGSAGRQAMVARERACGAEWKAAKAANQVATGMTWPKYWSDCDKRKKAEGM